MGLLTYFPYTDRRKDFVIAIDHEQTSNVIRLVTRFMERYLTK